MNRFNLSFKGEIQPGYEPGQVKARFGKMFGIDDPVRLERFFSGNTIILRRNLERKTAAEYYSKLRKLGVEAELIKVTAEEASAAVTTTPADSAATDASETSSKERDKALRQAAWENARREAEREAVQRHAEEEQTRKRQASEAREKAEQDAARRRVEVEAEQQRVAEETARRRAEEAQTRQQAEEQAQQKAEQEATRRVAQEKEARRKAKEDAAKRRAAEEEAQRKAEEAAAKRKAEEKEARRKAEAAAAKRKAEEKEARRQAEEAAAKRKAEEKEARRKAEEAAAKRRAEEEEARRKAEEAAAKRRAEEEEARRKAEEEAARRKAQEEEARRQAREAAARRRAEKEAEKKRAAEEAAQRKAEEAARRQAEREEKQRVKAEQAARDKARRERERREAAEKAARQRAEKAAEKHRAREEADRRRTEEKQRKAEETAKRKAAEEEARLRAAEAAAIRAAEKAELQRVKAEEIAHKKTAEAERRRLAREEAERKRAAQAKESEQQKAKQRAERETAARQEKEARERAKKEQAAAEAADRARQEALLQEQESHRRAMEEQAIGRAAKELTRPPPSQVTAENLPAQPQAAKGQKSADVSRRKRQPGAPNLFSLRPFRNTAEVKSRVEVAQRGKRRYITAAGVSLCLALLLAVLFGSQPTPARYYGASAATLPPGQGPLLLAGDTLLMHDRAGLGIGQLDIAELGLSQLGPGMLFTDVGELLALGKLAADPSGQGSGNTLVRCQLEQSTCSTFASKWTTTTIGGFTLHPLDDSVFLLDNNDNMLVRIDAEGTVLAKAALDIPAAPVMRLHHGLLFMNSDAGPAISVFRYDDNAFGKQLDEILLLPAPAVESDQKLVRDFIWNAQSWWVTLTNVDTGSSGVYRFDVDWNYLGKLALSAETNPEQLLAWGEKTLVRDSHQLPLQRFNATGDAEVPMQSGQLEVLIKQRSRLQKLTEIGTRSLQLAAALVAIIALVLGGLQGWRTLVYRGRQARGAQPVDDIANDITWIDPDPGREAFYRRLDIGAALLCVALVLVAVGNGITVIQLTALLLALGGLITAVLLLQRSPIGHIGVVDGQLLLVDHANLYHLGSDARVQYRGSFLMLDDVIVFLGNTLLPAFSQQEIARLVHALAEGGVRVDRKTVLIKLLQAKHPLARALTWLLAGCLLASLLLLLQW